MVRVPDHRPACGRKVHPGQQGSSFRHSKSLAVGSSPVGSAQHNRRKQLLENDLKKGGAIRNQIVSISQNIADSTAAPEQITDAPDSSARARPSSTGVSRAAKKLARKATPPRRMAPYVGTCPEADRTRRPVMSGTASASATWDDRHAPAER